MWRGEGLCLLHKTFFKIRAEIKLFFVQNRYLSTEAFLNLPLLTLVTHCN